MTKIKIKSNPYTREISYLIPACLVIDEKTHEAYVNDANGMKLADKSISMKYGYSVSQEKNLSEETRRKILTLIIDNGILTNQEIVGYIDFFIRQRKSRHIYDEAIEKWESDRNYIEGYRVDEYEKIKVGSITKRY